MTLEIRALTPTDAEAFQAVRLRGLQDCPTAFASSYDEEASTPFAEIEQRLRAKPDATVFGAFQDATLVALVGLQRETMAKLAHKAYIWGMYVVPEARNERVGEQLLTHALAFAAKSLQVTQVNLGVNTNNIAAIALYQKLGFVEYGLERRYLIVDGVAHDEYQMVCVLEAREKKA